ncbi:hypothetical protein J4E86_010043 [Alternaria arbusti]|uniref:uncharacterized protein n=1 Tax=Alternaria arbusti TaxID=232088 RepID=UPI00222128B8|nr:uncharacterized protein J4E86_010043 [Alternaria arbusti]KAI4943096.1 hypothetical protein J4E86_010043 [Alternaria arbusti]
MVGHDELNETELRVPDPFSVCEVIRMQIDAFPDEFIYGGKLTPDNLPLVYDRSVKLLEDMKAALSEARTKVPVKNRHMRVEHWIWMQRYEEAMATMKQTRNKLRDHYSREMLLILKLLWTGDVSQETESALAPFSQDGS